jgi:outer membrane beta-barrel protein
MKSNPKLILMTLILAGAALSSEQTSSAAPKESQPKAEAPVNPAADPDAADLDRIRNRYWAQGNETEMGVVQNRTYTKQGKIETWFFGGLSASDPFLDIKSMGLTVGYHFNEQLSVDVFGFRDWISPSSALTTLEKGGKKANTNPPLGTVGAEVQGSLLYGKLSLLGRKILYYDMHTGLGAAATSTETGINYGPVFSIGQSVYITRSMSFRVDYRLVAYREDIIEKEITTKLGQIIGARNNFSNNVQVGFSFLFGGEKP